MHNTQIFSNGQWGHGIKRHRRGGASFRLDGEQRWHLRPERQEEGSHEKTWGKSAPRENDQQGQWSCLVEGDLARLRNMQKAELARI